MENKYFTPSIEDIRVGYECEICPNLGYEDKWIAVVGKCEEIPGNGVKSCNLDELTYDCLIDGHIGIRVPYLTKEQIEKEGWQDVHVVPEHPQYSLSPYRLSLQKNNKIRIYDMFDNVYFVGECKDINTFRYICKLLNISKQ